MLTLFHHADVHAALQPACLAVAPVVLGDGATAVEGTREGGLALHAAPEGEANRQVLLQKKLIKADR